MRQDKTVLITAIGSFSADIVIKTAKRWGWRVIGCDIYQREWLADSSEVDCFYQVPYATGGEIYVEAILDICREERVDQLLVLTDVEIDVWDLHRREARAAGVTLCIPSEHALKICRDKMRFSSFLGERGIGSPIESKWLDDVSFGTFAGPVVCKPYNGRSSQGLKIFHTSGELESLKMAAQSGTYLVQPYIKGSILTVDVVRQADSGRSVAVCRKELLRTANGAGTSVLVFQDEALEETCRMAAEALNINGCVNFEFIEEEDGSRHILECNPRFSGGVEFSCMAGYDCVSNHIRCFDGEPIEERGEIKGKYIARKYEEYITGTTD